MDMGKNAQQKLDIKINISSIFKGQLGTVILNLDSINWSSLLLLHKVSFNSEIYIIFCNKSQSLALSP